MTISENQIEKGGRSAGLSPGAGEPPAEKLALSAPAYAWAVRLLLGYFGVRLVFFALALSSFVPPDEVTHAGICKVFSRVWLLPANGPETWQFGLVTDIPWLYYWIMGKLLHLNVFGLPDLVFLRLGNIPLAFGTLLYSLRLLRLFTKDRLTGLLLLVALTNTAMFSLLSASVSYDNLVNLLAVMAIYYALAFFRKPAGSLLAASLLCQLAGCLTKISFLPLVLVLNLLLAGWAATRLRSLPGGLRGYLASRRAWWQLLLLLLTLGFNIQLYAGNYLRYGTLSATMSKVLTPEISQQNRIGAREEVFALYEAGKVSYMDALQMAGNIAHPGDKADTFYLLMNYENLKAHPERWLGPVSYTKLWFQEMLTTSFGIKGHLHMFKSAPHLVPVCLVLALALAGFAVSWRRGDPLRLAACLGVIALFYGGFLLLRVNYPAYTYYGNPGITLQGRYLFPVLAPIHLLVCTYLLRLFRAPAPRLALALAVGLFFLAYDFPWFLAHAGPEWFSWLPQ
jgi:hypothetical protein